MNELIAIVRHDSNAIIAATAIVSVIGAMFGILLSIASKIFYVHEDEKITTVRNLLPGANCGACGFAGCDAFAAALAGKKANASQCPVSSEEAVKEISKILGVQVQNINKKTARVFCAGSTSVSKEKFQYQGIADCFASSFIFSGHKACNQGCLGNGNCVRACPFGAIDIIDGVAIISQDRCKSCELCVEACPRNLISMIPSSNHYTVTCHTKDKGSVTHKNCAVGCIGCGKCVKTCASEAISLEKSRAIIHPEKCINCGDCIKVCPVTAIQLFCLKKT